MLAPDEIRIVAAPGGMTSVRQLSPSELTHARRFLQDEGSLSDFYESLDDA